MSTPPRLARWLIERALPADVRHDVSGDLLEMYRRRLEACGGRAARRWYWRQTVSFTGHFAAERLREWRHTPDMSTGFSWIDLRLALRMLVRYPGLTAVGVVGMATAIAIAAAAFTVIDAMMDPAIPIGEGDRVVSVVGWDVATNNRELRLMHDFATWRGHLTTVQEIGAARTISRNLIAPGAQPETIAIAEMTASGFAIARVSPLLGRPVLADDERGGAPEVVVVGYEVWQRRFGGDPAIVGRQIQLGDVPHTVVGVMPKGFGFPVNHSYWIPWRTLASDFEPRTGPQIHVFGRLAPGATLESAQLEVAAVGERTAAAYPTSHEHLRPRVLPYAYAFTGMDDPDNALALRAIQTALVLLLVVVCVNVAILVYARTATRQGEIAVRSALGASRRRIVAQLFTEALILAGVAAMVGVGLVAIGLGQLHASATQLTGALPFWMSLTLSPVGVLYIVVLAVVAAAIVGVVPALKATGGRIQARLQGLSAGSGSRMQMGRLWTGLVVAQVAVAVALLPATVFHAWNSLRSRADSRGATAREVLTTGLALERPLSGRPSAADEQAFRLRYATRQGELERRLEGEGAVSHVTFSMTVPGEELALALEVEGAAPPVELVDYNIVEGSRQGHLVRFNRVAPDFFAAFDVPVLTGRSLRPGDRDAVVIGRSLAEQIGGESVLGRRVRYVGRSREADASNVELGRWYEIVGVVPDFPEAPLADRPIRRIYHPVAPGELYPAILSVRVRTMKPAAFAQRVREVSASVDPNLQLRNLTSVEEVIRREQGLLRLIGVTLVAVMSSVVVLSAAGIYALMSFTVSRRRKEIGIRTALGAEPSRILRNVFARAFAQLACGAALGMLGAVALEHLLEGEMFQGHGAVILPAVAVFMTTVGLLAAYGPARRGLAIQPTEALREE